MGVPYVQCLVCGRMTPVDRGICYHCGSPLPSTVHLPLGMIVCPNCLKPTPIDTGYCTHCRARLPPELVREARRRMVLAGYRPATPYTESGPMLSRVRPVGPVWVPGAGGSGSDGSRGG